MKWTTLLLIAAGGVALYLFLRSARLVGTVGGVGVNLGLDGSTTPKPTYSNDAAQIIAASGGAAAGLLGGISGLMGSSSS